MVMTGGEHQVKHYYKCCEPQFFIQIVAIAMLVLFAGLMSGLTLGLMSMSLFDLEVLAKSGTPKDRLHASKILPVLRQQHLLLCTLLVSNAAAMEALPIFLDNLVPDLGAILISVTLILLFGEIIPQSICTRYGLVIGAALAPIVRVLVLICFPVAYPISKLLDLLLGNEHEPLYRRAELKTLVDLHSFEAGKGGDLSHDEISIIGGALELTEKTARDAMTPLSETFAIDINAKLDRDLLNLIMEKGYSRVPLYYEQPKNIIGLVLVKNLLTINPADEIPVKDSTIRWIPRVPETMPLYDILNEFQKGHSHMAAVIKPHNHMVEQQASKHVAKVVSMREVRLDIQNERRNQNHNVKSKRSLKNLPDSTTVPRRVTSKSRRWSEHYDSEVLQINDKSLSALTADGEVIGIITMEDVIEELLNEEIYEETDLRDNNS
ncbi:DUF21 domain-containing protein At2g14520-like isoform X3 [Rhododendron vialii]|uniref:DUF21 domain-containing protein At2g14520-like isoform X3 n=1 Tax=Rhododendron vialii TaxID=182163 RepID=UPI00265EC7D1|nr:DUF21 domain-containing protein At2g14520-like isoform X3 [Rhododendron vialii]